MRAGIQTFWQYRFHFLFMLGGIVLGSLPTHFLWSAQAERQFAIREYDQRYEFIRPLLICQISEDEEAQELHLEGTHFFRAKF